MTTSTLKITPTRPGPDRPRPLGEISRRSRRLISVLLSSRRYEAPSLQARPVVLGNPDLFGRLRVELPTFLYTAATFVLILAAARDCLRAHAALQLEVL